MTAVVYERSGGFAGLMQRLRIEDGTLKASERGHLVSERRLSADEAQHLETLLVKLRGAPAPVDNPGAQAASDSYTILLSLGDEPEPRISLSTQSMPLIGAGDPWDEVLGWFDRLLLAELRTAQPPEAPRILGADELRER